MSEERNRIAEVVLPMTYTRRFRRDIYDTPYHRNTNTQYLLLSHERDWLYG